MSTPSSTSLGRARSGGDFVRRYFSIAVVTVVLACRLDGDPLTNSFTGGIYRLNVDTITVGGTANALVGYTVKIGTTAGDDDVGVMRIRALGGVAYLEVGEIAPGELKAPVVDGLYITVTDQRRPSIELPLLTPVYTGADITDFDEYQDYSHAYTDQNSDIEPKANISEGLSDDGTVYHPVKPAGFVDDGEVYRTMTLTAAGSLIFADGAAKSSQLWDVGDGSITVGTTGSETITVEFPVGYREISLTVVDSRGTSHTMFQPVWVHDSSDMPLTNFNVTSDETDEWRELVLEFFGDDDSVNETVYPKGTVACYWEVATYSTGAADFDEYRSHALGWVTEDILLLRKVRGRYVARLAGIGWWLKAMNGFAHEQIDTGAAPTRHYEMQQITCDKMLHWQGRHYSNAWDLVNLYITGETNRTKGFEIDEGDLWSQMVEVQTQNLVSELRCDSLSALWCRRSYIHLTDTQRASRPVIFDMVNTDWKDDPGLVIPERQAPSIGQIEMGGAFVLGNDSYEVQAQAPGLTLGRAPGRDQKSIQRLPVAGAVLVLRRLVGREFGRDTAREFSIEPIGNYDFVEPAWNEPITITYAEDSPRGTTFTEMKVMVKRVAVDHSTTPPYKRVTWDVEEVTSGQPGMEVPAEVINIAPDEIIFTGLETEGSPNGAARLAFVEQSGWLYWANDARTAPIVYQRANLGIGAQTARMSLAADLNSDFYQGIGDQVDAILAGRTAIYTIGDVFDAQTLTTRHTFTTALSNVLIAFPADTRKVVVSPTDPNNVYVVSWYYSAGTYVTQQVTVIRSQDGGITWGTETALPGTTSSADIARAHVWVSQRNASRLFAIVPYASDGDGYYYKVYRSTDGGLNWSDYSATLGATLHTSVDAAIHITYQNNSDESEHYVVGEAPTTPKLQRWDGTTFELDATQSPDGYYPLYGSLVSSPLDAGNMAMTATGTGGAGNRIWVSDDGGDNWTDTGESAGTAGEGYVIFFDDDPNALLRWGAGGVIAISTDLGDNWTDKSGNLSSFTSPTVGFITQPIGG